MTSIVWLRRDLRLHDNVALYEACRAGAPACVAFVLDSDGLRERFGAPIVQAFLQALASLREQLRELGSDLAILEGVPATALLELARRIGADALYFNEDYEPQAISRDERVTGVFERAGLRVHRFLDHVYFGAGDIVQNDGTPYRIFTPYKRRWLDARSLGSRKPMPSYRAIQGKLLSSEAIGATRDVASPEDYGHRRSSRYPLVSEPTARATLDAFLDVGGGVERYKDDRNVPALDGTSRLSPHLRAGTIGIRECVERAFARGGAQTWIDELIWRDFYATILRRFPRVAIEPFKESAKSIPWRNDESEFAAWCEGRTGYPIVDAAMRQLNETGWMHNRLRMIVASFLTKHLLIDWRWGERYFERQLADADLASNNGGWQWAASTGTDAVPYFRIFSPARQAAAFDPDGAFVRAWIPELIGPLGGYPAPIVEHDVARRRALAAFSSSSPRA